MTKCEFCQNKPHCDSQQEDGCELFSPVLNAERIRRFDDMELAIYLSWLSDPDAKYPFEEYDIHAHPNEIKTMFDWLQTPTDTAYRLQGFDATPDNPFSINTSIFDLEEIYPNCTVQIWRNSISGDVSIGWIDNDEVFNDEV